MFKIIREMTNMGSPILLKGYPGLSKSWSAGILWKLIQFVDIYRYQSSLELDELNKF